jgi:4'-phosphopantetheinyl transferase
VGELIGLLSPDERVRAAAFASCQERIRYVHSHGVLRQILSRYANCEAAELAFESGPHQKPRLHGDRNMHFNLSHSGGCCLVAVRAGAAIGVDVEQLRDLPEAATIAQRWLSRAESDALARLSGSALQRAFFTLWTHREAVIKALGENLETGLRQLACALDTDGSVRVVSWRGDEAIGRQWRVRSLKPAEGYLGAIATVSYFGSMKCFTWNGKVAAEATFGS